MDCVTMICDNCKHLIGSYEIESDRRAKNFDIRKATINYLIEHRIEVEKYAKQRHVKVGSYFVHGGHSFHLRRVSSVCTCMPQWTEITNPLEHWCGQWQSNQEV